MKNSGEMKKALIANNFCDKIYLKSVLHVDTIYGFL